MGLFLMKEYKGWFIGEHIRLVYEKCVGTLTGSDSVITLLGSPVLISGLSSLRVSQAKGPSFS